MQAAFCNGISRLTNKGAFVMGVTGTSILFGSLAFLHQIVENKKIQLLNEQYLRSIATTRVAAETALKALDIPISSEAHLKSWGTAKELIDRATAKMNNLHPLMREQLIDYNGTVLGAMHMAEQGFVATNPGLQAMILTKVRESLLTSKARYSKLYIVPLRSPWKSALKTGSKAGLIAAGSLIAWKSNRKAKRQPTGGTSTQKVGELTPDETAEFEIMETIHDRRPPMTEIKQLTKKYGQDRVLAIVQDLKTDLQFAQKSGKLLDAEDLQRLNYYEEIEKELRSN